MMAALRTISFDGVIVGGGGAGMRAALQLAQSGFKTAVISKVFPTRSHTVSAQGGITCAIASADLDEVFTCSEAGMGKTFYIEYRRINAFSLGWQAARISIYTPSGAVGGHIGGLIQQDADLAGGGYLKAVPNRFGIGDTCCEGFSQLSRSAHQADRIRGEGAIIKAIVGNSDDCRIAAIVIHRLRPQPSQKPQ